MLDSIINRKVDLIVNTTIGKQAVSDLSILRRIALDKQVP